MANNIHPRVQRIIRDFIHSDYFASWQAGQIESGAYSRNEDRRDRFNRCAEAAEDGADGSTHHEVIADMREAFTSWVRDRKRGSFAFDAPRLAAAADRYFDNLEAWHTANSSIDQEIG